MTTSQIDAPLMMMVSDDICWQAALARDARYDGVFVLAVHTTGIYCRPSCPARKPNRENVSFYEDNAAAESAGFRACKRCRPQLVSADAEMVEKVCRYIEANPGDDLSLAALGTAVGYSPYHLQRVFKRVLGISPRQYAEAARTDGLKTALRQELSVTDAVYSAGFNSSSTVYDRANGLGMEPRTYQRGGRGMTIGYTIADSMLGRLLIAATHGGVSAISIGDRDEQLVRDLHAEFPNAVIQRDDETLGGWVSAVLAQLDGEPHTELPLDVQATAFQRRVYTALLAIPRGETRSYSAIARDLGEPHAARAVARACATNRLALVIPCHRVVREDGGMGGYRWGVTRKEALLKHEREGQREQG